MSAGGVKRCSPEYYTTLTEEEKQKRRRQSNREAARRYYLRKKDKDAIKYNKHVKKVEELRKRITSIIDGLDEDTKKELEGVWSLVEELLLE